MIGEAHSNYFINITYMYVYLRDQMNDVRLEINAKLSRNNRRKYFFFSCVIHKRANPIIIVMHCFFSFLEGEQVKFILNIKMSERDFYKCNFYFAQSGYVIFERCVGKINLRISKFFSFIYQFVPC